MDLGAVPETMIYISHRGNVDGPLPRHENTPAYIDAAIYEGFFVEVDVWGIDGKLWFGHDKAERLASFEYLESVEDHLFFHCKNVEALRVVRISLEGPAYFFHQKDDYTMTSNGFVWCYPGKVPPGKNSIVLLPEIWMNLAGAPEYLKHHEASGVCSDFVAELKNL